MDLHDTPDEAGFRERVRGWLHSNVPEEWKQLRGTARGRTSLEEVMGRDNARRFQQDWHRKLYDAGFVGLSWPKEYGGQGLVPTLQFIWQEEYARAKSPPMVNTIGLGWAGPAIIHHGSEEQKRRYLPKILSGEEIWCQLFSEPGAGSDLAGLTTRAVLQDDTFVVNGQKVWTTIARDADYGILLARTDPEAPKHRGISFLLCDMSADGIDIRPIKQMNGSAEFNEVFFTDVRVPKENLVGDPGGGWPVTITTLMHERIGLSLAPGSLWGQGPDATELVRHVVKLGGADDAVLRHRLAEVYVDAVVHRMLKLRLVTEATRGGIPGASASIQKMYGDALGQRLNALAVEAEGLYGNVCGGSSAIEDGFWQGTFLFSPALTIGGGTTEVQKNILGERVLGLPKEPGIG